VGCGPFERRVRGISPGDTACFVGTGCPATVVAEVIPSSPKTVVVGGPSFGAGRLVSLDLRVIEEGRTPFLGGEIEAVEGRREAPVFVSRGGEKGRAPVGEITGGLGGDCCAGPLETSLLLDRDWLSERVDSLGRGVTREDVTGIGNFFSFSETAPVPDEEPSMLWDLVGGPSREGDGLGPLGFK
jgi:hypothetical protein